MKTQSIRLGTMLSPLSRVKPWELAARAATLDQLSGGRVQLAVGLGALHEGWLTFERGQGRRVRAELMDEGLAVYDGCAASRFLSRASTLRSNRPASVPPPPPVQQPRVPVWAVGAHPGVASLRRAAAWDGLLPAKVGYGADKPLRPDDLVEVVTEVRAIRAELGLPWYGYQVVAEGVGEPGPAGSRQVREWVDAGATWWVESDWADGDHALHRHWRRIEAGPPDP